MCSRRLLTLGGSIAASLLIASSSFAALPSADQKCIDGYNNFLRLVSAQAGKDYRSCVKNAAKGTVTDPQNCIVTDVPAKIAGKELKVTALYAAGGKCDSTTAPIQQGAATGNGAHVGQVQNLTFDMFGNPILASTLVSVPKADGKCQDKAIQRSGQAFTEIIKAQRSCKKNGMKSGAITDEATLDTACGTFALIDAGGKAAAKLAKISTDVIAACGAATLPLATDFPGVAPSCQASPTALGLCLQARTRCRACLTLNTADGQNINCDTFDDGTTNSSCFEPINVGSHTCTLGPSAALNLGTQALPLNLVPTGSLNIACGTTDALGKAACSCTINSIGTLVIPAIGDVCVNPFPGCPSGEIDCNGGNSLNTKLVADHNIGACANDAACGTACNGVCAGLGASYQRIAYGCEGSCQGGPNNNNPCTLDAQCPSGQCPGADPVVHTGVCQCTCQGTGLGGASPAGSLACEVGTQIDVELPTDGDCLDPNTITLPGVCGAVTTTTAQGSIVDANNAPAKTIPPIGGIGTAPASATGASISCDTLAGSSTSGLTLVGYLGFYDSTLGDIFSANKFACQ